MLLNGSMGEENIRREGWFFTLSPGVRGYRASAKSRSAWRCGGSWVTVAAARSWSDSEGLVWMERSSINRARRRSCRHWWGVREVRASRGGDCESGSCDGWRVAGVVGDHEGLVGKCGVDVDGAAGRGVEDGQCGGLVGGEQV